MLLADPNILSLPQQPRGPRVEKWGCSGLPTRGSAFPPVHFCTLGAMHSVPFILFTFSPGVEWIYIRAAPSAQADGLL
jgi:hypothetical protein